MEPLIPIETETPKIKTDRQTYMREYMKRRHQNNIDEARKYGNSNKWRRKNNVPPEEAKLYGIYLADVLKLKKIMNNLPPDILNKVFATAEV